uniref:Secreted protein n=1 Tax=Knipowitschia caucasica TaxID=637954 RepID=A0AAV2JC94_KNICA
MRRKSRGRAFRRFLLQVGGGAHAYSFDYDVFSVRFMIVVISEVGSSHAWLLLKLPPCHASLSNTTEG